MASQPVTGGTYYISFNDNIYQKQVNAIMAVCNELVNQYRPDELYFLFASLGGQVAPGIALYNFLQAIPPKITMHNIGRVDSIGNVVYASGDKRLAAPYTSFLFHGLTMGVYQPTDLTIVTLKEWTSSLDADARKISGIIRESSEFTEAELLGYFAQGEAIDAEIAKQKRFVHEVVKPTIPANAQMISINVDAV